MKGEGIRKIIEIKHRKYERNEHSISYVFHILSSQFYCPFRKFFLISDLIGLQVLIRLLQENVVSILKFPFPETHNT